MVLNRQTRVPVAMAPLRSFLARVQRDLKIDQCGLSVCLVSDRTIAALNAQFRGKRGPTDVLSFRIADQSRGERKSAHALRHPLPGRSSNGHTRTGIPREMDSYLGDIAISAETARRNARRLGRSVPDELRILILHGVLHLLGYDHEADAGEMDRVESRLRKRLALTSS